MSLVSFVFYFFEAAAALSAIGLTLSRNVFYGALFLIACLLSVAGIYVLAVAEFVAITQILIYAGGILVVVIFGIMLTTKITGRPLVVEHNFTFAGATIATGFFILLVYVISKESFNQNPVPAMAGHFNHVNTIGMSLFSTYMLPFEMAGILLLMALIGAAIVASTVKTKKSDASN